MSKGLTFDDVLMPPKWATNIKSREECDVKSRFSRNVSINIPIASANMRTVTDAKMCKAMYQSGGIGILHRYFENQEAWLKEILKLSPDTIWGMSIGVENYDFANSKAIVTLMDAMENGIFPSVLVIDVANAENNAILEFVKQVIEGRQHLYLEYPNHWPDIVVGNIATAEAASRYKELDIDGLKVGIGPGAACTTRIMTGCGVPQFTAIREVARVLSHSDITLIADGGIKNPGDAAKALAAGADCVMMGRMLAVAKESPGWKHSEIGEYSGPVIYRKTYQGEASFRQDRAPEGVKQEIVLAPDDSPKPVSEILETYKDYIQSSMSYQNARNIYHFQANVTFEEVSNNTLIENNPRG